MDYQKFLQKYPLYIIGTAVVFGLLIAVLGFTFFASKQPEVVDDEERILSSSTTAELERADATSEHIYVDIKGAVKKPGMYEGSQEMRVWDAVMLAGGVQEDADTKQVNFSERISDQMVIYVPKIGEIKEEIVKSSDSTAETKTVAGKINLNQASETELTTLSGIGQKKAQEIIRYREENGGFKSIEDLKNISGFGDKTFERLKDLIKV